MPEADGWEYYSKPSGGDCRKIVTLEQSGMTWVGIRAFANGGWINNGEPERADVIAWRDLPEPANGRFVRGQLILSRGPQPLPLVNPDRVVIDARDVGMTLQQEQPRPEPPENMKVRAFD